MSDRWPARFEREVVLFAGIASESEPWRLEHACSSRSRQLVMPRSSRSVPGGPRLRSPRAGSADSARTVACPLRTREAFLLGRSLQRSCHGVWNTHAPPDRANLCCRSSRSVPCGRPADEGVWRSGYADIHGSGKARSGCMYSESAPVRTVEPLEALGIESVVGSRGGCALRPRRPPKPTVARSS